MGKGWAQTVDPKPRSGHDEFRFINQFVPISTMYSRASAIYVRENDYTTIVHINLLKQLQDSPV